MTAALVFIGEYASVPPGLLIAAMVCVVIFFMAINTPISIAIGLACLVYLLARGNIQLLIAPITIIGGHGLVRPPGGPPLYPGGRVDEYRRHHDASR